MFIRSIVWFQHYRKENFHDDSLPPGKWTKRESKQNWVSSVIVLHVCSKASIDVDMVHKRIVHLKSAREKSPISTPFSRGSGYTSPTNNSGYQTPREIKEELWGQQMAAKPSKNEMREMYKTLGGRKARAKTKLSSSGVRDKGGWDEGGDW